MLRNLARGDLKIQAGIFAEDSRANRSANGSRADDLAYRLRIHDQGLGNNPERQVLQPAMEKTAHDFDTAIRQHMNRLDGQQSLEAEAVGRRFSDNMKLQFPRTRPQKKESTVRAALRRYGGGRKTTNLIQTGEMRQAISFKVIRT